MANNRENGAPVMILLTPEKDNTQSERNSVVLSLSLLSKVVKVMSPHLSKELQTNLIVVRKVLIRDRAVKITIWSSKYSVLLIMRSILCV